VLEKAFVLVCTEHLILSLYEGMHFVCYTTPDGAYRYIYGNQPSRRA